MPQLKTEWRWHHAQYLTSSKRRAANSQSSGAASFTWTAARGWPEALLNAGWGSAGSSTFASCAAMSAGRDGNRVAAALASERAGPAPFFAGLSAVMMGDTKFFCGSGRQRNEASHQAPALQPEAREAAATAVPAASGNAVLTLDIHLPSGASCRTEPLLWFSPGNSWASAQPVAPLLPSAALTLQMRWASVCCGTGRRGGFLDAD